MRSEGLRGHIEDCVRDLAGRLESRYPKGSRSCAFIRQPIADFCGVGLKTATRWLHSPDSLPNGTQLIKLMCYLQMIGYRVIEWEKIPVARRNFAELLGFGILSVEQARVIIGYSTTTTTYQVLLGHYGTSKDKDGIMWETWKSKMGELEGVKSDALQKYRLDLSSVKQPRTETQGQIPQAIAPTRFTAISYFMDGLKALLEDKSFINTELDSADVAPLKETISRLQQVLSVIHSKLKGDANDDE